MFYLPLPLAEAIFRLPFMRRPRFLVRRIAESPATDELGSNMLFLEIRSGFPKWGHLQCPKCGDHIQLPLAGSERWSVYVDWLCRPTLAPSIWERSTCGAHFFVRQGELVEAAFFHEGSR